MSGIVGRNESKSKIIDRFGQNVIAWSKSLSHNNYLKSAGYFTSANTRGVYGFSTECSSSNTWFTVVDLSSLYGSGHYIFTSAKYGDSNSYRGSSIGQVNKSNNYSSVQHLSSLNISHQVSGANFQVKLPSHTGWVRTYILRISPGYGDN